MWYSNNMKIVTISDTHNQLDSIIRDIPAGDILIHSGDATGNGSIKEIARFNEDLGRLPHKHKIFIPGNHDRLFETNLGLARSMMTNAIVLVDEMVEINGLKIYGSPWQPEFYNWAFNLPRGSELIKRWAMIPPDVDMLVTHGPPQGILDYVEGIRNGVEFSQSCGCEDLYNRVEVIQPKLHIFGHIHYSYGTKLFKWEDTGKYTTFVNSSICTESYLPNNKAIVIDWLSLK